MSERSLNIMKKLISILSIILCAVMLLSSCSQSSVRITENVSLDQNDAEATDLVLADENLAKSPFVIVYNSDTYREPTGVDSARIIEICSDFAGAFYAATNNTIESIQYTPTSTKYEILIGVTGRENATAYRKVVSNYKSLGKNGFLVQASGNKVFIMGTTLEAQYDAIAYFTNEILGYRFLEGEKSSSKAKTVTIPNNFVYIYQGDDNQMTTDYVAPTANAFSESVLKISYWVNRTWDTQEYTTFNYMRYLNNNIGDILGKARNEKICFSDPDIIEELKDSCSGGNTKFYYNPIELCNCSECSEKAAANHSDAAAYFLAMNEVAKANPKKTIEIVAYNLTVTPPDFALESNIKVFYIERNFCSAHAINDADCPINSELSKNLAAWSRKTSKLIVFDFTSDYLYYPATFPNLYVINKNMRYYKELGAYGVQVVYDDRATGLREFADIRTTMYSYLFKDPTMSDETYAQLLEYTFHEYFGEKAGTAIFEYMNIVNTGAHKDNKCFTTSSKPAEIYSLATENEDGSVTYDIETAKKCYDLWQSIHPYIPGLSMNTDTFARTYYSSYESTAVAHAAVQLSKWMFDSVRLDDKYDFSLQLFEGYSDNELPIYITRTAE